MFVWANTSDAIATQAIAIIFDFIYFPFVSLEFIFDTRGGSCSDVQKRDYQGITFRSRKNLPVSFCGASAASQTMPVAPSPTERLAFGPPMSVRTQPGQTELTANFGKAAASCEVTPLSAVFEMQ